MQEQVEYYRIIWLCRWVVRVEEKWAKRILVVDKSREIYELWNIFLELKKKKEAEQEVQFFFQGWSLWWTATIESDVSEAREELMRMLAEDELRDAVLLIFANKQVFQ